MRTQLPLLAEQETVPRRTSFSRRRIGKNRAVVERTQAIRERAQLIASSHETHRVDASFFFAGREQNEKVGLRIFVEEAFRQGSCAAISNSGLALLDQIVDLAVASKKQREPRARIGKRLGAASASA